jgi:S-phase kinase-associated protein 1
MSKMLNETIGDDDDDIGEEDRTLQCPKVKGDVLKRVVEYCTHYQEEAMNEVVVKNKEKLEEIITQEWYLNYIKGFDRDALFPLIQAANYLDIQPLLNLSVLALCASINNKSEDEIREIFKITKPEPSGNTEGKEDEKVAN